MKKFPDNQNIQKEYGLRLLGNLASAANPDIKEQITDKYGIDFTFDILKKYPDNQVTQRYGLRLLRNLAIYNKRKFVTKMGLI